MNNMEWLNLTDFMDSDAEFIPLLSPEEEEIMNAEDLPEVLPILPLRNMVLFPGMVIPITAGRDKSIRLIRETYKTTKIIGVVSQKDKDQDDPAENDIYSVGTVANILKTLQMPDGNTTIIIQGKKRFETKQYLQSEPYFKAEVVPYEDKVQTSEDKNFNALVSTLKDMAMQSIQLSPQLPSDAAFAIKNIESPQFLISFIASNLSIEIAEKQKILEINDLTDRANVVLAALSREIQIMELKNQIQNKVKTDLDKQQRDYILNQQLKTIQEELGGTPFEQDVKDLKSKAAKKKWNTEIAEVFEKELAKLQRINPSGPDYSVQLNYLNTMVELPWREYTKDNFNLKRAEGVLNADHFGLEKVKERILEHLAVLKLKGDLKSPILCLVGPPGVGKTSLGKSIARALGRKYIRMSLGGLRDEAEIRGHRKTYIGAMPGRIVQNLKKAKSANPVFVLDEIDKIVGMNVNGDPAAALLEVLDPEQNTTFSDNFLEVPFDLSKVLFISTANTLSTIHPALLDRMEVIEISGYIVEEKLEIAKRHLVPKQMNDHGVKKNQLQFGDEILRMLIEEYTRESGVRQMDKTIAKVVRNRARFIASGEEYNKKITKEDLREILGPSFFDKEMFLGKDTVGVVTGLAWTQTGGDILFIESSLSKGKGALTMTGNLGDVMKESATLAFEFVKSHAVELEIDAATFENSNVHIHVPEGAVPKDGPSAGITMLTALASVFTNRKVRANFAMTGEITLRGKVLPVGGVKEKILAAKRSGITDIILSRQNLKNIEEIQKLYREGLTFHYVDMMKEVLEIALVK